MERNLQKKPHQVCVRLSDEQFNEFSEMAKQTGRTLADFIRIATMKYIDLMKETTNI